MNMFVEFDIYYCLVLLFDVVEGQVVEVYVGVFGQCVKCVQEGL